MAIPDIPASDITPREVYLDRRRFLGAALSATLASPMFRTSVLGGVAGALGVSSGTALARPYEGVETRSAPAWLRAKMLKLPDEAAIDAGEDVTPYVYAAGFNNFYEFGTAKEDPARYAGSLKTDPWTITVSGECNKPGEYSLEDTLSDHGLEERIYRLRCVEAWSMVVPWVGIPLAKILSRFEPNSHAKFVEFRTLADKKQMPGIGSFFSGIDFPYREGLRMDEAMHPLTIFAVGMYGEVLPPQNGAPFRLVVPWKYGFKSIKSIVSVRFTRTRPKTTWELSAPSEYGFYSNVNPAVDHPRWSQKTERRLPSTLFSPNRIDTLPFNGYAEQVAHLYSGMDLRRNF